MNNVIHVDFGKQAVRQTSQTSQAAAELAPAVEVPPVPETRLTRDEAIAAMREALRQRSGKAWSVKGGRGATWGWIDIVSPPRRLVDGYMSDAERAELCALLNLQGSMVATQGVSIPAGSDYYAEYVARCRGETPKLFGKPYWD